MCDSIFSKSRNISDKMKVFTNYNNIDVALLATVIDSLTSFNEHLV